jgi:AcrR family transcriptional regulator
VEVNRRGRVVHLAGDESPAYSYKRMKQSANETTRTALIRAGRSLFGRHGYNGASVRAITAAARTNLGAITYHFGTKRRFYDAVLEHSTRPLADAAVAAAQSAGTPGQRVVAVVRAYFEQLAADPEVARLMVQEFVIGGAMQPTTGLPIRRILTAITELVADGQKASEFRAGDPRLMAISIISQPVQMNLVRQPLKLIAGIDLDDAVTRERLIQHVTDFACAGLRA